MKIFGGSRSGPILSSAGKKMKNKLAKNNPIALKSGRASIRRAGKRFESPF